MDELIFAINLALLAMAAVVIAVAAAASDLERYDTPMIWKEESDERD